MGCQDNIFNRCISIRGCTLTRAQQTWQQLTRKIKLNTGGKYIFLIHILLHDMNKASHFFKLTTYKQQVKVHTQEKRRKLIRLNKICKNTYTHGKTQTHTLELHLRPTSLDSALSSCSFSLMGVTSCTALGGEDLLGGLTVIRLFRGAIVSPLGPGRRAFLTCC